MKAEDYITEWCDKTYKGGKELSDWTTNEVMKFANDFALEKIKLLQDSSIIVNGEHCPICKSNDLVDIDDHYTKCWKCGFSFVG